MSIQRIKWLILAISIIVLFYFFIPISIYNISPILISIIGSVLFAFFFILFIGNYSSISELFTVQTPKNENTKLKEKKYSKLKNLLTVAIGFSLIFIFTINFNNKKKKLLKTEGKKVTAILVDGGYYTFGESESCSITVQFESNDKIIRVDKNILCENIDKYYSGMKIAVIYLPDDPKIFELIEP